MVGAYAVTMLVGALGVIASDFVMLVGIFSGWGIAVAALLCVVAQAGSYSLVIGE